MSEAAKTWTEYAWPDWVPEKVRAQIESFWGEKFHRGPQAWLRDTQEQGAPRFGARLTMNDGFGANPPQTTGRYVHAWNNIGRLVRDDGTFAYTSFNPSALPVEEVDA